MAARQPALEVGQRFKIEGKTWTVAHLYAREVKLERNKGHEVIFRHSRTLNRMLGAAS